MNMNQNQYRQPIVDTVAPDAVVYIEKSRNISLKGIDVTTGEIVSNSVDFMNFVASISTSKGVDRVPGEASISVRAPKHMFEGIYGDIKDVLSTMLEVEIYMKGRFLVQNEPQYYPVFWGMITNLSESETAGDFVSTTITCQDMMRWLQVTTVNVQPSAYNSGIPHDAQGETGLNSSMIPFQSFFVGLSTPGIIYNLVKLSVGEDFFDLKNIADRSTAFKTAIVDETADFDKNRDPNDQLIEAWNKKFTELSAALYIYGYKSLSDVNQQQVRDVNINLDEFTYIYGKHPVTVYDLDKDGNVIKDKTTEMDLPFIDISKLYPQGAAAFNTGSAPIFEGNLQNRLDVVMEAKEQIHFEFYQDVDGTIVLKPPFYNMDTRNNPVYVIEDVDIENINIVEDESQVWTRIDVKGVPANGYNSNQGPDVANAYYGFAISFAKLQKYGLRQQTIQTNFIVNADEAFWYAKRELSRRNSLVTNGSISIEGRPELKLGYPIYIPSHDAFYYVTGIDHEFTFGESFSTRLTVTAIRKRKYDALGNMLKNLFTETTGVPSTQQNVPGKDVPNDPDNPMKNISRLCDPTQYGTFTAQRPIYSYKTLDDILKYQGTFRFIYNGSDPVDYDPRINQRVTDEEGYELNGDGFPFGRMLSLTEDFRIVVKGATGQDSAEIASNMQLTTATGKKGTLSFQQPLTLNQIQNVRIVSNKSVSAIIEKMQPSTESKMVDTAPSVPEKN